MDHSLLPSSLYSYGACCTPFLEKHKSLCMASIYPPSLFVNVADCTEVEFANKNFNF